MAEHEPFEMGMSKLICAEYEFKGLKEHCHVSEKNMNSLNIDISLAMNIQNLEKKKWIIHSRDHDFFKVFIKFCGHILMSPSQVGNCTIVMGARTPHW